MFSTILLNATEPFAFFYKNDKIKTLSFEGTVREVSPIPVPEKNDYPDCLYSAMIDVYSFDGDDVKISKELIINIPIMRNKKIFASNILCPGDKIFVRCAEYETMPERIKNIQISDVFQSFEHNYFYAVKINKIHNFSHKASNNFIERKITILSLKTLPSENKAIDLRKQRINAEIAKIETKLKKHGGTFDQWRKDYKSVAQKYKCLSDRNYAAWINDSFYSADVKEQKYSTKNYIEGILPYKKYFEANNIDLIILRIPTEGDFAARVLGADSFVENPDWIEHYYECLKNDIEIVDPMPQMYAHRHDFPLFYFYNNKDEHPFEGNAFIAAKVLAEVLERYTYSKEKSHLYLHDLKFKTNDPRFFYPPGNEKFNPQENITFKQVMQSGKNIGPLSPQTKSPFLFVSNSFFYYPQRHAGASLPAYTAFFIQHIPAWYYQNGTGNGLLRSLLSESKGILSERKAVIMVGFPWPRMPAFPKYLSAGTTISHKKTIDKIGENLKITGDNISITQMNDHIKIFNNNNKRFHFYLKLTIPAIENTSTCMVRINCKQNIHSSITVFDSKDNSIIEPMFYISDSSSADLFIPANSKSREINIKIDHTYKLLLKNIELWYF